MKLVYLSLIFTMLISSCTPVEVKGPVTPELYRVIFTTYLDSNNEPTNDLKEISIKDERIYTFMRWNISTEKHNVGIIVSDGVGKIVHKSDRDFTPTDTDYNSWNWVTINEKVDKPGNWKFEIFMDGEKVAEKKLLVTP